MYKIHDYAVYGSTTKGEIYQDILMKLFQHQVSHTNTRLRISLSGDSYSQHKMFRHSPPQVLSIVGLNSITPAHWAGKKNLAFEASEFNFFL